MQIGERVIIKEKRHLLYGNNGTIRAIRKAFDPWSHDEVLIELKSGDACYVPPEALRAA